MGFQIGGSILDFVVLSILNQEDQYGYLLTRKVRQILDVSETAMYPALKRLEKASMLESYEIPNEGRNRKYYRLTENGRSELNRFVCDWVHFKQDIDRILADGKSTPPV